MRILKHAAPLALATLLLALPAVAKQNNNGNGNANGNSQGQGKSASKKSANHGKPGSADYVSISRIDARRWAEPYRFEAYKPLPPGIRKNLARGKPIPPGLAYRTLPPAYIAHLPHYPGYEWRGYGSDLVLVAVASAVIADVILDVFD